jgi:hypothetical protein
MTIIGSWSRSTCTAKTLLPYIASGVIPVKARNQLRILGKETELTLEKGKFVVFISFLGRGLAFPTSLFPR